MPSARLSLSAMTTSRADRLRRRAPIHAASARRYRRNADALLERGEPESAGALLYESAKRCINAIANQQGDNPVKTTAKVAALQSVVIQGLTDFDLMRGWRGATSLHTHADQGYLNEAQFQDAWRTTQAFISEMLATYDRDHHQ